MSTDINQVILVGRLTRDAELKYTNSGTAVSNLSVACNEAMKQQDGTWQNQGHFFDVTLWGKQAEGLQQYLTKGRQIAIQGRLKQQSWTDQQTGQNRSKVVINAQSLELLAAPPNQQGSNQGYNGYQNQAPQQPYSQGYSQNPPRQTPQQQNLNGFSQPPGFDPPAGPQGFPGPEQFDDDIPF
jgi:single-strand DNA-binding protein